MNLILTFGALLAAMAAMTIFADSLSRWNERRQYRRATHPRNIEKTANHLLELELQQLLLEEEIKEKARNRMEHPSSYSKTVGGGLDGKTKEILAKLTDPRPARRDRNNQFWWGE
jgi:hypothetical protein